MLRVPLARPSARLRSPSIGFTLVELLVTLTILGVVMISIMAVLYGATRSKTSTTNQLESSRAAQTGLEMMAKDLRSSGFDADVYYPGTPQPPIAYIDSVQVLINANQGPYPDTGAVHAAPLAYKPTGSPRPFH